MTSTVDKPEHVFDVAVSFAGEDRALVEEIVAILKENGLKVFYDEDFKVESWGRDLIEYFSSVYRDQARFAVMFVSRDYAEKVWTRLERRSILARALNSHSEYALPVRMDDTDLPGLLDTVGYLDARREGVRGIADALLAKIAGREVEVESEWSVGAPRSDAQTQALLALKPPGWEYLYYVGLLLQGVDRCQPRFMDMEMRYAPYRRTFVDVAAAFDFLRGLISRYSALADAFNAVLDQEAQTRAFGPPGVEGDPDRIAHLANRLVDVYAGFLDVIEDARGTAVPESLVEARNLGAEVGERPVRDAKQFIETFGAEVSDLPQRLLAGNDVYLELVFTLALEDGVLRRWTKAMKRGRP